MSSDEPSLLEPGLNASPSRMTLWVGAASFLGGIAAMAFIFQIWGGGLWHAAAPPAPALTQPQPQATAIPLPPGTDLATLNAREQALAAQLDSLQQRLTDLDRGARMASSYANRAEGMMIAMAVRRSLDRGLPLGPLENELRRQFGTTKPDQVATIIGVAAQPVTVEDLRLALDTIAPKLGTGGPKESWWRTFRRLTGDLLVIREQSTPSPRTADRLERARRRLDARQVEAALAEVALMPGVENAQSWVTAARRYIAARHAIDDLELSAMQVPEAPAPAPAPVAAPAAL